MYAILSGGELLALCEKPRYVRKNPVSGAYVEAKQEEAEAVAVNGELYNLPGGTAILGAPVALISKGDVSEVVFRNWARIVGNEKSTGAAIGVMENALCEQDAASDARMGAIEDAVCELDSLIGGGENG